MTDFLEGRREKTALREARAKAFEPEIVKVLLNNFDSIKRIYIFGSLAEGRFGLHSDIDVAVEGIPEEFFIRSMCVLNDISDDFDFDLVELNCVPYLLKKRIYEKGMLIYERRRGTETFMA